MARRGSCQTSVFTCRPLDYLDGSECPKPSGPAFADAAEGSLRVVDLGRVIQRT